MKKIILLFAAVVLFSCSDDDSKQGDKYYVDMVVAEIANGPTVTFEFDYNNKKQLVTITATASASPEIVAMTYEDNMLKTVGDNTLVYEDGQLVSFLTNSGSYPIEYDSATGNFLIDETYITLNKSGDIINLNGKEFEYDETKKGGMASQSAKNLFMISYFTGLPDILSRKAITKEGGNQITNTYDDNGYVKKAVFAEGMYYKTLTYSYTKL